MSELRQFVITADTIWQKAREQKRLTHNPSDGELRKLVEKEPGVKKTLYRNFVAHSEPTSRSAMFTKNSVDHRFGEDELRLLSQCEKTLGKERLISVDRLVGNESSNTTVRLIVPERFAHVAYGGKSLFIAPKGEVMAMLDDGRFVKIIRNGNYIGEYKKGVFAAEDWAAKTKRGGIFLHAGCREDYLQSAHGDYRLARTLLVALSANGKTTTTCRILARKGREKSWLIQDDGGTLMPDGSFHGFEAGGIFVKTEGVNPGEQTEIYYGLLKPQTVCENVYVTEDGDFDFYNLDRTSNGRAVVLRRDFMHASRYIDVDRIDNLILITRGPLIPAISKLTREQAAALMVLGQAMESSAGDPTQAGKIRSEFFYDPFVAGDLAEHANVFYEIIEGIPHFNYYLINTGGIGEAQYYRDIRLESTMAVLDSLLRGGLEDWVDSPTGFKVPRAIRYVDDIYSHPEKLYSSIEFEERQRELNKTRYESVQKLGDSLHPEVRRVFGKPDIAQ